MDIFIESADSDSDLCECGIERETVPHFMFRCHDGMNNVAR
jgi:hypothetical protein